MATGGEENLTAEQVAMLSMAIARMRKRRRIMLGGYLLALLVMLIGLPVAILLSPRLGTVILLAPLTLVAIIFVVFGRWERGLRGVSPASSRPAPPSGGGSGRPPGTRT